MVEKDSAAEYAAQRRADHIAALEHERTGYETRGLADRAKQVDAEIARVKGAPVARREPSADKAAPAKKAEKRG